jgi:ankyrin repeat protein
MASAVQVPRPTPLLDACGQGDLCLVQRLVAEDPRRVATERNVHGATALIVASWSGHLHIVMWLVNAAGAAPQTERSTNGSTAFLAACERGHLGVAQWLLRHGGSRFHELNQSRDSALILACANNRLDVARWLYGTGCIQLNADINDNGANALVAAAWFGHLEVVQWFLTECPESIPFVFDTVMTACRRGHLHILEWMAGRYAVPGDALNVACSYGQLDVARWLAEHLPKLFSYKDPFGFTPFMFSCERGHLQVAKWLASVEPGMIHVRGVVCVACLTQHATHS